MKYSAHIRVSDPLAYQVLKPEETSFHRAGWTITKKGDISITAQDTTALKAMINSVSKALNIIEKTRSIQ
ncbi:MAG: KEOPS complex subunit Pcc1 [Candidatus Woesearchaeota archaeon]